MRYLLSVPNPGRERKVKFGKIVATGMVLLGVAVAAPKADAAYVAYLYQSGANVVGTGSGSINFTDLTLYSSSGYAANSTLAPQTGFFSVGQHYDTVYSGVSLKPTNIGTGVLSTANASNGGYVSISPYYVAVPTGYTSGALLGTSTATWDSTTLSGLGVTPGPYTWTWGTGANADSFTLYAGTSPVPEPASLAVLAVGLLGLGISRRRVASRQPAI